MMDFNLDVFAPEPEFSGGGTALRARATTEVIAGLRRARRRTSVPTNPVAPVITSFILMLKSSLLQKLLESEGKESKKILRL